VTDDEAALRLVSEQYGVSDPELARLFVALAQYLDVVDPDSMMVAMATAVSVAAVDRDPLWVLLVGPSSGSKTESIRTVFGIADRNENDITVAGFLTGGKGTKDKPARVTGMLPKLGDGCNAFVTVSDMGSVVSQTGGNRSGSSQSQIFNALRDIYDGSFTRTMAAAELKWTGRLTFLAGVTPAIDELRAHQSALGTRWVYYRLESLSKANRRKVAKKANRRDELREHRKRTSAIVEELVEAGRGRLPGIEVSDETNEVVEMCADIAGYGRVNLPRDYRGFVTGVADWEEPGRLAAQLGLLASSLAALRLDDESVQRIVRHAACSCMPPDMLAAIREAHRWRTTYDIAESAGLDRHVATRALEAWEATGVIEERRRDRGEGEQDPERDRRAREWRVTDEHKDDVQAVVGRPFDMLDLLHGNKTTEAE
jgi:hypothetical protein